MIELVIMKTNSVRLTRGTGILDELIVKYESNSYLLKVGDEYIFKENTAMRGYKYVIKYIGYNIAQYYCVGYETYREGILQHPDFLDQVNLDVFMKLLISHNILPFNQK